MKTVIKCYIPMLFALFSGITGCATEPDYDTVPSEDGIVTTFSYTIPGMMAAISRTEILSGEQEAGIGTIDVLVYEVGSDGKERLAYHQWGTALDLNAHTGTFKVKLAKSETSEKYTIDFLFNARDVLRKSLEQGDIVLNDLRDDVRKNLGVDTPHWEVTPGSYLPMWARMDTPTVIDRNTVFSGELIPIRAVAKLDIGVNMNSNNNAAGLENFELQSVYFTSYAVSSGLLIPHGDNINGTTAIKPTLPEPYTQTTVNAVMNCTEGNSIINGIYLFELDANYEGSGGERYGVIFKGKYSDDFGTGEYYYRLEFFDPDDSGKRINFLRNYRYRVNIVSVDGPGYTTLQAARDGSPGNVVYELSVNEAGDINHVVYSDRYMLGVSSTSLSYESSAVNGISDLKVLTNYEKGWKVSVGDGTGVVPDWIGFSTAAGQANTKATAQFNLNHFPFSPDPRTAIATFTAGTLSIDVKITQYGNFYISTDYDGSLMRGDGDQWDIYVWGEVPPDLQVRASSPREGILTAVSWDTIQVPAATYFKDTPFVAPLGIMGNAWIPMAIRQVSMEYTLDGGSTWWLIEEGPQGKGHFRLPLDHSDFGKTGRIVSLYNIGNDPYDPVNPAKAVSLSWAEAMGIDTVYNSEWFYLWNPLADPSTSGSPIIRYWKSNYGYTPTEQTGCADYYEEGYPEYERGKWRLPSSSEMLIIKDYYLHIGDLPLDARYYWSSNEDTGPTLFSDQSYAMDLSGGGYWFTRKVFPQYIRCVYGEADTVPPTTP